MRRLLILLIACGLGQIANAQSAATLISDTLTVEDGVLTASGNVTVFYRGTTLSARSISYDRNGDRLSLAGPIFIAGADGDILTADAATLDPQLENGMLQGARLVLDQQLQLAANQIDRIDGRYSQLYKIVATSCAVCGTQEPLWSIRAESVIHDEDAQQLYFTNAVFRVKGVPIAFIPRIRLPDPTLDRATGLLIPRVRTNDRLGPGIKLPYFITFGPSRDLTLTPYLSGGTNTLEARYRQAFLNGTLNVETAISRDDLTEEDGLRGYLFAEAEFDLGRDYQLSLDLQRVSDKAYIFDYEIGDQDRLASTVQLTRVRQSTLSETSLSYYESLRDDESNRSLPPIAGDFRYERRLAYGGGYLRLTADGDVLARIQSVVGPTGRDMARIGAGIEASRQIITREGFVLTGRAGLRGDLAFIDDDPAFDTTLLRGNPTASLMLSYPLVGQTPFARHRVEPIIMLGYSARLGDVFPNEDSTRPELNAGNLFTLGRYPGQDRISDGAEGAAALRWTRQGANGLDSDLTLGRVFQRNEGAAFNEASGLNGRTSDWLIAGQFDYLDRITLDGNLLLDDDLNTTLGTARLRWRDDDVDLAAAYIWQEDDPAIGRSSEISEWNIDGDLRLTDSLSANFNARYDIVQDRPARAGFGATWQNECVTVDLSVSRRYTSSTIVEPSTSYGFAVGLKGFSTGRSGGYQGQRCN